MPAYDVHDVEAARLDVLELEGRVKLRRVRLEPLLLLGDGVVIVVVVGGYQLSWSTVGCTPCGVAMLTPRPPSVNASCASMNSLAQKPVGCGDPSFIVQTLAPVRTISASATVITPFDSMEAYNMPRNVSNAFHGTLSRAWRRAEARPASDGQLARKSSKERGLYAAGSYPDRASSSAETSAASAAPIHSKIATACRSMSSASAVPPAARAHRPRPASACASSNGLPT